MLYYQHEYNRTGCYIINMSITEQGCYIINMSITEHGDLQNIIEITFLVSFGLFAASYVAN